MVQEGELLWTPGRNFVERSGIYRYMQWLKAERGLDFDDYHALWRWSVDELEAFWATIWDYFGVMSETPYARVLDSHAMPGAKWFEGSRVNYAEHVLRHEADAAPGEAVFHHLSEIRPLAQMSWQELGRQVRIFATQLRETGIGPGDRVVSYMPNIPETAVAMLAATAIGATWSSAAPEFGSKTVIDRFGQIEPKMIFVADGYRFAGKDYDRAEQIRAIVGALPTLEHIVWLPYLHAEGAQQPAVPGTIPWRSLLDHPDVPREGFRYERVAHDHPLWVLFSSGTTGLPKPIVHSHVGIVVEHYKTTAFHLNLSDRSCMFFYTTTGWMMWNALMCSLLMGGKTVLYDGNPAYPEPDLLWRLAAEAGVTSFGTSPTFIGNMRKLGLAPREKYDLSRLEGIFLAGSPSTPETFTWFYEAVKDDLWMTSQSGGTEFCSGLVGASPTIPVYAGEIQARTLGADIHAWNDEGEDVIDEVGELVITKPMPSMPLYLWGDKDFKRYKEAYFDHFPGVWRHGDFLRINQRGGCFIYGRSDSTLNRFGVRIGSAEIYRTVDTIDEIADSLIVCIEEPGGGYYMPLFVRMKEGHTLDDALIARINDTLRQERSPRHVPDEIIAVPVIPYTLSAKKMEVPVRKLLMGWPLEKSASRDAMMDPKAIDWFVRFAETHLAARRKAGE